MLSSPPTAAAEVFLALWFDERDGPFMLVADRQLALSVGLLLAAGLVWTSCSSGDESIVAPLLPKPWKLAERLDNMSTYAVRGP